MCVSVGVISNFTYNYRLCVCVNVFLEIFCGYFYIYIYIYIYISLNKFPDFFRMGTFIDSIHMKL